jgi:O-methyltransferase involved in polyketide biosynthesis
MGESEAAQQQAQLLSDHWREHGLDLDATDLTYPGEHTDVAAHLQAHGWDTTGSTMADLLAAAGLPPLEGADLDGPPVSIDYVRATRK